METIDITEDEKSEYSDEVIDAYKWSYVESIVTVL
jgi:hypothetical protein